MDKKRLYIETLIFATITFIVPIVYAQITGKGGAAETGFNWGLLGTYFWKIVGVVVGVYIVFKVIFGR